MGGLRLLCGDSGFIVYLGKIIMIKKMHMIALSGVTIMALASPVSASWFDKIKEVVGSQLSSDSSESTSTASDAIASVVSGQSLSTAELTEAFQQTLELGSQRVVEQLGATDGFNKDSLIRISLPSQLQTVKTWLDKVGLGGSLEDLEVSLNRAAESAVPKAKSLFVEAIKQMSFEDIKSIYNGGDDAATRYFQSKMTPSLTQEMAPLVQQSLSDVGAVALYDNVMGDYKSIPFVPDVKADLVDHVVDGGLTGIFHYLAKEEAAIRENPVKRTTELLKKVFGTQ